MLRKVADGLIDTALEGRQALADGHPVVALESTIITHGMPYPENVETARAVEAIVREGGAVPATIAVIGGRIVVGVESDALDRLGSADGVVKASRRDLASAVVAKQDAGTTVAATMAIAARAGIEVFATGGIGGVHRGVEATFDISADLVELSRTPVAVVCAGCKSILDIGKTLEFLETQSVPVVGYRADEFPAFFARTSGFKLDHRFDTPEEIAEVIRVNRRLGGGGVLIANPIPEADALDPEEMEAEIVVALREAEKAGVGQKEVTPFILKRLHAMSGGRTLGPNIALIKNNALVAAQIAVALARLPAPS
jgi:pseudouridine-5'-phosphate glycosidase